VEALGRSSVYDADTQRCCVSIPQARDEGARHVVQKYRPRAGQPAAAFQKWIHEINDTVKDRLVPALRNSGLLLSDSKYAAGGVSLDDLCLAQIPEFNSLIAKSQEKCTPVFALTEEQLGGSGSVLDNWLESRDSFNQQFTELTEKVITMIEAN
jgi:hypothetical protein